MAYSGTTINLNAKHMFTIEAGGNAIVASNASPILQLRTSATNGWNGVTISNDNGVTSATVLNTRNFTQHLDSTYINTVGDTMTGTLYFVSSNGLSSTNTASPLAGEVLRTVLSAESGYSMLWRRVVTPPTGVSFKSDEFIGITRFSQFVFRQDVTKPADTSAKWVDNLVYHQGFKPTPADIGAVASTGSTVDNLVVRDYIKIGNVKIYANPVTKTCEFEWEA